MEELQSILNEINKRAVAEVHERFQARAEDDDYTRRLEEKQRDIEVTMAPRDSWHLTLTSLGAGSSTARVGPGLTLFDPLCPVALAGAPRVRICSNGGARVQKTPRRGSREASQGEGGQGECASAMHVAPGQIVPSASRAPTSLVS